MLNISLQGWFVAGLWLWLASAKTVDFVPTFSVAVRFSIGSSRRVWVQPVICFLYIYLQSSLLAAPPAPPQRACLQQKIRPQELKKQQKKSMAMSTIKMTPITMPAMAPVPILAVEPATSLSTKTTRKENGSDREENVIKNLGNQAPVPEDVQHITRAEHMIPLAKTCHQQHQC